MKPLVLASLTAYLAITGLVRAEEDAALTDTERSLLQAREEAAVIPGEAHPPPLIGGERLVERPDGPRRRALQRGRARRLCRCTGRWP